ncbi:MAG: N-methyl-L-tryptophan oxidase [Kofleriaceae bacterium]
MSTTYDVIVLGLGGMGSAAAAHLARRGQRVLGLEQFALDHELGSSQGETRLIRKAYYESPRYVPLLERAYELWDELGGEVGAPLLHRVGLALYSDGAEDPHRTFARALATARQAHIPLEELDAAAARARFPAVAVPDGVRCLFEPSAGFLEVERCVAAHLELARRDGAELRAHEPVARWRATAGGVEVETSRGMYQAGALVIAAGPWSARVLAELGLPLTVHRVMQLWFPASDAMTAERGAPCFAFDVGGRFYYGFPRGRWGAKICEHAPGAEQSVDGLDAVDRELHPEDFAAVAEVVRRHLPEVEPAPSRAKACFYTMTPDADFLLDTHREHPNVHFVAGLSGHGFKFASVLGEALADLAVEGRTRHAIDFLRAGRSSLASSGPAAQI